MDLREKNEQLSKIFLNLQDMIRFADSKANISLSIQGLLLGVGLGVSLLSNSFEKLPIIMVSNLSLFYTYIILLIGFISSSIIGIIIAVLVYKARGPKEETEKTRKGILYFGHIIAYENSEAYIKRVKEVQEEELLKDYSSQIYQLSHIADSKMRKVNRTTYFLFINIILTALLLTLSGIIIVI